MFPFPAWLPRGGRSGRICPCLRPRTEVTITFISVLECSSVQSWALVKFLCEISAYHYKSFQITRQFLVIFGVSAKNQEQCLNSPRGMQVSIKLRPYTVIWKQLLISNDKNRVRCALLGLSQDRACTDLFENLSVIG